MRLSDLVKDVTKMSDTELLEHVRQIRHNKFVARPALQKHKEKPAKKEGKTRRLNVEKLTANLSPEQIAALLSSLEGGSK